MKHFVFCKPYKGIIPTKKSYRKFLASSCDKAIEHVESKTRANIKTTVHLYEKDSEGRTVKSWVRDSKDGWREIKSGIAIASKNSNGTYTVIAETKHIDISL